MGDSKFAIANESAQVITAGIITAGDGAVLHVVGKDIARSCIGNLAYKSATIVIGGMYGGIDDTVVSDFKGVAFLFVAFDTSRNATGNIVIGFNYAADDGIVKQIDKLSIANDATHVGALIVDAGAAVGDTAVADGGVVIGAAGV